MKQVCKNCLQIWILLKIALNLIYKTFYFNFFHFIYPVMHYGYKRKLTTFDKFPIPDLNSPSNCSYFDITYMLLWRNQIMSSSSPGVNIAIAGAIKQVWKNCVQIWILLKNPVNLIYRTSHLDNIKFPTAGCSGVFCVLQPN